MFDINKTTGNSNSKDNIINFSSSNKEINLFQRDEIQFTITWDDLERLGVYYLTRESCAWGLRALCNLTSIGKKRIEDYFGVSVQSKSWGDKNFVASILLEDTFIKPFIKFCLLYEGFHILECSGAGLQDFFIGVRNLDDFKRIEKELREDYQVISTINKSNNISMKGRNIHRMSKRFK